MSILFKEHWYPNADLSDDEQAQFISLEEVFAFDGPRVTGGQLNDVIRWHTEQGDYYIKRYHFGGKSLRRYCGLSRAKREWYNLLWFEMHGIKTPEWVSFAEESCLGMHRRAVLITRAVPNSVNLVELFESDAPVLQDLGWRLTVGHQIMDFVGRLHRWGFIHGDLKWRNIVLGGEQQNQVFFIDCPQGRCVSQRRFSRAVVKELACLAKRAPFVMSRHEQMHLLKAYLQCFPEPPPAAALARAIVEERQSRYPDFFL